VNEIGKSSAAAASASAAAAAIVPTQTRVFLIVDFNF
jgi:hypothetical protein